VLGLDVAGHPSVARLAEQAPRSRRARHDSELRVLPGADVARSAFSEPSAGFCALTRGTTSRSRWSRSATTRRAKAQRSELDGRALRLRAARARGRGRGCSPHESPSSGPSRIATARRRSSSLRTRAAFSGSSRRDVGGAVGRRSTYSADARAPRRLVARPRSSDDPRVRRGPARVPTTAGPRDPAQRARLRAACCARFLLAIVYAGPENSSGLSTGSAARGSRQPARSAFHLSVRP